jgi:hypothetical protein
MTLTPEEIAMLPADVQEALAAKPSKAAEELSKTASDASYEAGKDPKKSAEAMLAHAKAAAAHRSEADGHRDDAKKAEEAKDYDTAAQHRDAARKSDERARHEADQTVLHAQTLGHGPFARFAAQNVAVFAATMDDLLGAITDPAGAGLTAWVPVLYPGKYNDLQFTAAMLKEMVETFNPKAEACPVKIGHEGPDTQAELSQVREVKIDRCTLTNGRTVDTCLWVRMTRTPEALASQTKYRKTSIEAWPPTHQSNPSPGKWNLKGLAFLGAAAPAVPNLPATKLSASTGAIVMTLTPNEIAELQAKAETQTVSLAAAGQEALKLRRENEALGLQLSAQKKASHAAEIKAEIGNLSAKLLPAQMELAEAVALALDSDEPTVALSGTDTPVSPRACFLSLLEGMKDHGLTDPLNVPNLSGKKTKDTDGKDDDETLAEADFRAKKVKEFRDKNPKCTMAEALRHGQQCVKERAK